MIGYLLGIGDRHTNNILIDSNTGKGVNKALQFATGELVHIDFGIVFEKGKTLAIPEIVPFRLTRDLVSGLGPMMFEGPFRMNCEVTLEVNGRLLLCDLELCLGAAIFNTTSDSRDRSVRF